MIILALYRRKELVYDTALLIDQQLLAEMLLSVRT